MGNSQEYLKVKQTAEILERCPETVRRLDRRGILKSKRDYLGHRVFFIEDILAYKAKQKRLIDGRLGQN